MNKKRLAAIIATIITLVATLIPIDAFAKLDPGGGGNGTSGNGSTQISSATLRYKYAVEIVDYNIQNAAGTATGSHTDASYTGPINTNLDPDKVLDYDHPGTITMNVNYSTTGTRLIEGQPIIAVDGVNLGDVWQEDNGKFYKLDGDGNTIMTTAVGGNAGNAMTCTFLTGAGNSLENFHNSVFDCAKQMQTWSAKTPASVSTTTVKHDEIAQFENTPEVNIDGQITTLEGDGKSHQAHADAATQAGQNSQSQYNEQKNGSSGGSKDACYDNGGPLGWIICPIIQTVSSFSAWFYGSVVEPQLEIQASSIFKTDGGVYQAWSGFRDIANLLFVIAFLAIIISQLTGYGIDNYGIKRMLPRLVIAAILINLSYFICQLAVDVANIAGISIANFLNGFIEPQNIGDSSAPNAAQYVFTFAAGATIGVGALLIAGPAIIITILMTAVSMLISLITLLAILTARQAAVIILIVVSPIALVCYLLPNTEGLTKKWLKLAEAMLLLYPICSLIIAAGSLAGNIIASAAGENQGMVIAAMLVQVVPYLAIPALVKNSMAGLGNLGARISNLGQRAGKGATTRLNNSELIKDRRTALNNFDPGGIRTKIATEGLGKRHLLRGLGRQKRIKQIAADNERRSEELKLKGAQATNMNLRNPDYQEIQANAFEQQRLEDDAKIWTSKYDGKSIPQDDFVDAMRDNDMGSGKLEGIINAYMDKEDFGGLSKAMAAANNNGASPDAMKRAANAMKSNRRFGKLSEKKTSLGEWAKDPSKNFSTAMEDNIASFKQKDWSTMDGDERNAAFQVLNVLKAKSTDQNLSEADRKAAADRYTSAVNTMHAAANNQNLQSNMTDEVVKIYKNYDSSAPAPTDSSPIAKQSSGTGQDIELRNAPSNPTNKTTPEWANKAAAKAQQTDAGVLITGSNTNPRLNLPNNNQQNNPSQPTSNQQTT